MQKVRAEILKELEGLNKAQAEVDQHKSRLATRYIRLAANEGDDASEFARLATAAADAW